MGWWRGGWQAWCLALCLALLGGGCDEQLPDPTQIERVRPLGARWEPSGAPQRAWPRPGERAEVRWSLAFPGEARPLQAALAACPAAPGRYGLPQCAGGSPPQPLAPCDRVAPWQLCGRMQVPATDAEQLLVMGILCVGGSVRIDPAAQPPLGCTAGSELQEGLLLRTPLWDGQGAANHHPPEATVRLDGTELTAADEALRVVATEGCPDEVTLPRVAPFEGEPGKGEPPHRFQIELPASAAEPLPDGTHEPLLVAHLVTAGKLARRFSDPEPTDDGAALRVEVGYWPPAAGDLPPGGRLVRLHVTVRDGRGGFAETMRALCVARP